MLDKKLFIFICGNDMDKVATNIGEALKTTSGPTASGVFSLRNGSNRLRGPAQSIVRPVEPFVKVDQKPSYLKNKTKNKKELNKKQLEGKEEPSKDALSYTSATK